MMNFVKKKKEEKFSNGRVVVTDFRKLKKDEFSQHKKDDMFFLNYDGKIYINSNEEANEAVIMILKMFSQYPKLYLKKWEKEQKRKYPHIKTVEDLVKLQGDNENLMKALSMFLVPLELKSRDVQRDYYGIV